MAAAQARLAALMAKQNGTAASTSETSVAAAPVKAEPVPSATAEPRSAPESEKLATLKEKTVVEPVSEEKSVPVMKEKVPTTATANEQITTQRTLFRDKD